MNKLHYVFSSVLALVVLTAFAPRAQAAQGYIRGTLQFYQYQGQFCATNRNCKGANYPQSQFGTFMGVAEANLVIKNRATGGTIGFGSTSANGDFTAFWITPFPPVSADIYVRTEHSQGRFSVRDLASDAVFEALGVHVDSLIPGTTSTSPQQVGTWRFGSASSPHAIFNVYDGAWRTWAYALRESNLMWQSFTSVKIRVFASSSSGTCTTSCADAPNLTVTLDDQAAYSPQARVMHELGHVAAGIANPHHAIMDLSYPSPWPIPGSKWFLDSAEYAADAWEEGFATFIADAVMYEDDAPTPFTCGVSTAAACPLGKFNVEYSPSTCDPGEERWPLTVVRTLRDYYDTVNEAGDTRSTTFAQMLEVWASYGQGRDDHQIEEPYDENGFVDNRDGRSVADWQYNYDSFWGSSTAGMRQLNCNAL